MANVFKTLYEARETLLASNECEPGLWKFFSTCQPKQNFKEMLSFSKLQISRHVWKIVHIFEISVVNHLGVLGTERGIVADRAGTGPSGPSTRRGNPDDDGAGWWDVD